MQEITVELFSGAVNSAVMRIPGRNFPGVLIQGDSLSILYNLSDELLKLAHEPDLDELVEVASELKQVLSGYLYQYEAALKSHNMSLPYTRSISDS